MISRGLSPQGEDMLTKKPVKSLPASRISHPVRLRIMRQGALFCIVGLRKFNNFNGLERYRTLEVVGSTSIGSTLFSSSYKNSITVFPMVAAVFAATLVHCGQLLPSQYHSSSPLVSQNRCSCMTPCLGSLSIAMSLAPQSNS